MLYTRRTFTLPATNKATEVQWDLSFLSAADFMKKHGVTLDQYKKLAKK